MSFAMDASAAAALAFDDERGPLEESLQTRLEEGETAYVPPNFHQELVEALLRGVRRNRISSVDASAFLAFIDVCDIQIVPIGPLANGSIWLLAQEHNLSAYDAGYLHAALQMGVPLASGDIPLRRKARSAGAVLLGPV
jgi:predicted nucleic acid-binding protein